jgi:hypothetical protein
MAEQFGTLNIVLDVADHTCLLSFLKVDQFLAKGAARLRTFAITYCSHAPTQ